MANNGKITRIVTQDNFVTEKIDVIQNNLLGVYDDEGNYSIAPQIIEELLKLHKVKRATFANSVFCVGSLLGYGEIVFELTFSSKTHNGKSASATIYLLEDVDKINGYLQNTIKTKLEDFNDDVENFIEETYKHFNIDSNDEDEDDAEVLERKLDEDLENEDSFIIAKKQYSLILEKLLEEKFLDAYGKYFTARISLLTKMNNEFSQAVLGSFNSQYSLIQNVFLQEKNYKVLNELLDKCFEEFSGTNPQFVQQEKEYSEQIKGPLDSFVNSMDKLNEKFENKALNMLGKEDRKKVEEILDEHQEKEESQDVHESKQSVENLVNNVTKNAYTRKEESQKTEQNTQQEKTQDQKETHFIEEILKSGKEQESQKQTESQNFYNTFKEQHSTNYAPIVDAKVVDTARSEQVDTPNRDEEVAVTSLKDRMSRLERFKTPPVASSSEQEHEEGLKDFDSSVNSIFDNLAKEKERKIGQYDIFNKFKRMEIDNIEKEYTLSQKEIEEAIRNRDLYRDGM